MTFVLFLFKKQKQNKNIFICALTCVYPSKVKVANLSAVMAVSWPFICSMACVSRSCKFPVSSWKPHITTGWKRKDTTTVFRQVGGQQSIVYESVCRYSAPKNGRSERGNCTRAVFASFFFFFFFCKLVFSGRRILAQ